MANLLGNISGIWSRTSLVQRVILLTVLLGCVGASVFLVGWARKPNMVLLYSSLNPEEAGKIVEKVNELGSPYEIRDGGGAIYVPEEKVYSLRLSLASQGLPKGDQAGYRILDEEKIGISPFAQRVNYLRAVEGELAKTIGLIDGVTSARVHVVRPEQEIFAGRDKEASATVMLRLRPGWRLTGSNVAAIVHLLAGSVEGLRPEKVVVVDAQGSLLSNQNASEMAGKAASYIDYKRSVEEYLAHKAEEMLASALGPNKSSIRVDATIEMTNSESTIEKFSTPGEKGIRTEKTKTVTPTTGPGSGKEDETTTDYIDPPKTVERKTEVPGKIVSLTVAAMVDLSAPAKPADASAAAPAPAATAKVSKDDVEKIIRSAIGLKPADTLTVVETSFYRPEPGPDTKVEEDKQATRDFYLEIARRGSLGLLVIGVLVAMKIFRGGKKKAAAALAGTSAGSISSQVGGAAALPGVDAELDPELLKRRISQALQENPDEVKRLFLNWVESEKGAV